MTQNFLCMIKYFTLALMISSIAAPAWALDTDIYQSNVKQNCYILLDASDSMGFGVYESNVDYGAMYDYLLTLNEDVDPGGSYTSSTYNTYIYDRIMKEAAEDDGRPNDYDNFYQNHSPRNRIYLVPGNIGISARVEEHDDGSTTTYLYSGDAADPNYLWYGNAMRDTYTNIDPDGNLVAAYPDDPTRPPKLTVDDDGYILYEGDRLPLNLDILYRHEQYLYGGGKIEDGFGDQLNAPGYYFSGFTHNFSTAEPVPATGSAAIAYFFITGNWMNMQQVYNLEYLTNNPTPQGAHTGDPAWQFERFPLESGEWPLVDYGYDYPEGDGVPYQANLEEPKDVTQQGAIKIKLHFSEFDINATADSITECNSAGRNCHTTIDPADMIIISTADGTEIARYNNSNFPADGWTPEIAGDTAIVTLISGAQNFGTGYTIDKLAYLENVEGYLMKTRLGVATSAILNTIEEFRGKINWGTFTFPVANGGDGATSQQVINPNLTDDATRENIASNFGNIAPADEAHGTPIGEALQEVFEVGYYQHRNAIDNLSCRKNYSIVLSDGFPHNDDNWGLIDGVTFGDFDNDGFRADPYKNPGVEPPENFYDDVAHWMYTHSWLDKSEIPEEDAESSYVNVRNHQIAFGFQNPLMQDAAEESGGMYITAYNEGQLNAAFYALGLAISEAVSFTAPVVSVDEANKVQNGDDLYMGQFLPMDSSYWPGNLKKFRLGDGSAERPDVWQIYDASSPPGNEATDANDLFIDNTDGFWGDENDDNDNDNYGGPDIKEDGVGEVLTEFVQNYYAGGMYYVRNIVTLADEDGDGDLEQVDVHRNSLSPENFGLSSTNTLMRDKIINWLHGYTFDADPTTGDPVDVRDWALGPIVHSRPTVVDYYSNDLSTVETRYLVVGADDGMLHVFDDSPNASTPGAEVFAFVPTDALTQLSALETEFHIPLVDGPVKLFRFDGQPKYLFFALRRGGRSIWRIDVSSSDTANWEITQFTDAELGQSWSDFEFAKIRTSANRFTNVVIFSGGYDPEEDNYPEPFNDVDNNGTPYADNGNIDNQEWASNDAAQDILNNNQYDVYNPNGNSYGRSIYVLKIQADPSYNDDGSNVDSVSDAEDMTAAFSVKYGVADLPATKGTFSSDTAQTRTDFNYCFPATPSVVTLSEAYSDGTSYLREDNILSAIYAPDIYGNLFRITYDYNNGVPQWQVKHIFSANPAGTNDYGDADLWQTTDSTDAGRKVFYGPAVSWRGSGRYFDPSNYYYSGVTFENTDRIASLFFGTGDRVHPSYKLVKNRVYAIYDDSPITAADLSEIQVSSVPYNESDLLNITCDELGIYTVLAGDVSSKLELKTLLFDDVTNPDAAPMELDDGGAGENDAKGWYIILEQQGLSPYCDHCTYAGTVETDEGERDYHYGEKVLSKLTLFSGNLYFTTYQPSYDDPCVPEGNAFNYALNYLTGAAALNLNTSNDLTTDDGTTLQTDVTDRYGKHSGIKGIPSGFEIVVRDGEAGAMASVGGKIIGGGEDGGYQIPYSDAGIDLYYWIER